MLVLSRRKEETIVFPELGITVEVVRVEGNKVRLGIKAPDSVRILRGELEQTVTDFEVPCYVEPEQSPFASAKVAEIIVACPATDVSCIGQS